MGGRDAFGQLTLATLTAGTALFWMLYQSCTARPSWSGSWAFPLFALGLGVVVLQLIELPADWIQAISPRLSDLLPANAATAGSGLPAGGWHRISIIPYETTTGLVAYLGYGLLFWVASQRIRQVEDAWTLLRWIGVVAGLLAIYAWAQFATADGKYFWFFDHPYVRTNWYVCGSFTNRNNFANLLAMSLGPLVVWSLASLSPASMANGSTSSAASTGRGFASSTRPQAAAGSGWLLPVLLTALVAGTALATLSRGGMVSTAVALAAVLGAAWFGGQLTSRALLGTLGSLAMFAGGLAALDGNQLIESRLQELLSADVNKLDSGSARRNIWNAGLKSVQDFPWLGVGVGGHREIHPVYLDQPLEGKEYTHAESGYLNLLVETGWVGGGIALAALALMASWCLGGLRRTHSSTAVLTAAAASSALAASLIHNAADFAWYCPACVNLLILLGACARAATRSHAATSAATATSSSDPVDPLAWVLPRPAWWLATCAQAAVAVWMVQTLLPAASAQPHWFNYLHIHAQDETDTVDHLRRQALALSAAVKANPSDPRLQLYLAQSYIGLFEVMQLGSDNEMSLNQLRDAALNGGFATTDEKTEWLGRAVGKHIRYLDAALVHSRKALAASPLEGLANLFLAELSFVESDDPSVTTSQMEQAARVRPYEPRILFTAGRNLLLTGDPNGAMEKWQAVFHRAKGYQQQIIELLANGVPAQFFVDRFQPELPVLQRIAKVYQALGRTDQFQITQTMIANRAIELAEGRDATDRQENWVIAARALWSIQEFDAALECAAAAAAEDESAYEPRFLLGTFAHQRGQFALASEHLMWCAGQKPEDQELQRLADEATRKRHAVAASGQTSRGSKDRSPVRPAVHRRAEPADRADDTSSEFPADRKPSANRSATQPSLGTPSAPDKTPRGSRAARPAATTAADELDSPAPRSVSSAKRGSSDAGSSPADTEWMDTPAVPAERAPRREAKRPRRAAAGE